MFRLIQECESSGISQAKFIHDNGIAKSTFGYWRKKYLRKKHGTKSTPTFIAVNVDHEMDNNVSRVSDPIELSYPNGVRLTCSSQMDLSRLKPLIIL